MIIRKIKIGDGGALLNFFKELVFLDKERVERPEDVNSITKEKENKWIKQRLIKEDQKDIFILCGVDSTGKIVVEGEVERLPRWIERHVAEIRFGMLPGHESIAKEVVKQLIKKAENNSIEILIYFHLETQKAGIKIMKKFGFKKFGRIKNYYKRNEKYINRLYLVKYL